MASPVTLERNGPILEITLDRPPANAIDLDVGRALHAAFCTSRRCRPACRHSYGWGATHLLCRWT